MKKLLMPLLLFLTNADFSQNTGSVNGTVIDKQLNQVLIGASVSVKGTNVSTSTNDQGKFIIRNLLAGKIVLEISYVGYERMEAQVEIDENDSTVVTVSLNIENRLGNAA